MKCPSLIALSALVLVSAKGAPEYEPPIPIHMVAPDLKSLPDPRANEGSVVVRCWVDADGAVGEVAVVRTTDPRFNAAAIAALKQWEFKPAQRRGRLVAAQVEIPILIHPPGE